MDDDAPFTLSDLIEPFVFEKGIVRYDDVNYRWNPSTGLYEPKTEAWIKAEVQKYINQEFGIGHVKKANVDNLADMIRNRAFIESPVRPPFKIDSGERADVFPVSNGFLDIARYAETGELVLEKHDRNIFAVCGSPCHYDPEAEYREFIGVVRWMVGGNESLVTLLQQFCAWVFVARRLKLEAILWLHGPGGNGKSTFLMIIRFVLGEAATSAVALQAFNGRQRFALSPTVNSLANFTSDAMVTRAMDVAGLNSFVSGDPMTIDRKHVDPVIVTPATPCFVASNPPPVLNDDSDAFYRRLVPILCDQRLTREEMDPQLLTRLKGEAPGILRWMLAGVPGLLERKRLDIPESVIRHRGELKLQVNSARLFIAESVEAGDDTDWLALADLMGIYSDWCKRNGYRKSDALSVKTEMHKAFGIEVARLRRGGGRMPLWVGVRWKEDNETDEAPGISAPDGQSRLAEGDHGRPSCPHGYPESWDVESLPSTEAAACHSPSGLVCSNPADSMPDTGPRDWDRGFYDVSSTAADAAEGGRS